MPVVIKNLCKSFGDKKVLNNLNLTLEDGKIYCLMGPSGMGKTTLLRILLNLETKDSGEITGIDPETEISSMFQEDRILPMLSAIDNVNMMYEKRHSVREIKEDLASILPVKCLRQPVRELSGGMKRRVSLARAVHYPGKLIILDEPFTGLDHATKEEVISYILKNRGNRILLVATHGLDDASLLGAEVIHLEECQEWPSDQKNAGPFSETSVFKQDAPIQKKESASVLGFCPGSNERKILDGIPKKDWENLDEILGGYVKEYEEGAVIWNMGDCEKDLAIVLEGEATAYIGNMRQNDSLIARFEPGRCFGEMLPLSQVPSPVKVVASKYSRVLFLPADKLHEQTEDLKENQYKLILSGNLLYEMSHKIRHIVTKLTTTVEMTVREKLIRYLLSQPVDQDGWISMTEKQIDIARFISVSPEALSREFKDMEEEGLIQKRNKKIKIGDREALMLGRRPKS